MTVNKLAIAILNEFVGIYEDDLTRAEVNAINHAIQALEEYGKPVKIVWSKYKEFEYKFVK